MNNGFDAYENSYGDVVGKSIDFSGLPHDFFMQAKVRQFARLLTERFKDRSSADLDALDIGCGVGTFHPFIRNLLPKLSGCDISAKSIERARLGNGNVAYESYDGTSLPYEDNSFDFAFTICVVHHVSVGDWPTFFSEMKRVLRPGGCACVVEHNPLNPLTRLAVFRCPFDHDATLLSSRKTTALFRAQQFVGVQSRHFLLFPFANRLFLSIEDMGSGLPIGAQYISSAVVNPE